MSSQAAITSKPAGYDVARLQRFTPEQMELFQGMFKHLGPDSFLSRLASGDEGAFAETEGPAKRQFQGLMGGLASKFSGMGTGGRKSSGFQMATSQAASDFASDLQSRRQKMQRQALMDLMGMSTSLLGQRPYEEFLTDPEEGGFMQRLLGGALPIGGMMLGGAMGGIPGAMIGGQAGAAAGKAFR